MEPIYKLQEVMWCSNDDSTVTLMLTNNDDIKYVDIKCISSMAALNLTASLYNNWKKDERIPYSDRV